MRESGKGPYAPNDSTEAEILAKINGFGSRKHFVKSELRIIASSIQVVSSTHGWETWGNFPQERKKLLEMLKKQNNNGTIILSGDRHSSEISKLEGALNYPLFDITSSAMNQKLRPKFENIYRLGKRYFNENFGLLKIDWLPNGPKVRASIQDINGEPVIEYELGVY